MLYNQCCPPCIVHQSPDLSQDGRVGQEDLIALLARWGPVWGCPRGDLDMDGVVDQTDLLILLEYWGVYDVLTFMQCECP